MTASKKKPGWSDLKKKLTELDQSALLALVHDLYSASKDNQIFLHTRFSMEENPLELYKKVIKRWISPEIPHESGPSISKAKKAITDYRKAVGDPANLAELCVFYCECCTDFLSMVWKMKATTIRWQACSNNP